MVVSIAGMFSTQVSMHPPTEYYVPRRAIPSAPGRVLSGISRRASLILRSPLIWNRRVGS
jgi:hypothetical protein